MNWRLRHSQSGFHTVERNPKESKLEEAAPTSRPGRDRCRSATANRSENSARKACWGAKGTNRPGIAFRVEDARGGVYVASGIVGGGEFSGGTGGVATGTDSRRRRPRECGVYCKEFPRGAGRQSDQK